MGVGAAVQAAAQQRQAKVPNAFGQGPRQAAQTTQPAVTQVSSTPPKGTVSHTTTVAPKPTTGSLSGSAFDTSTPLTGSYLKTVLNQLTQGEVNSAEAPYKQNAVQLTNEEKTVAQRLAGYNQLYNQQLSQNAANAQSQSAGAAGSTGIDQAEAHIGSVIASDPQLAGAASDGGARSMIANEIAAQRIANAATTGAGATYASQVGGNQGQLANAMVGSGLLGASEGQANVASTFGKSLANNQDKENLALKNVPADYAKNYETLRHEGFTEQATLAGLGIRSGTLAAAQTRNANTAAYQQGQLALGAQRNAITASNDQANNQIKAIDAQIASGRLSETERHNLASEKIAWQRVLRTNASKTATPTQKMIGNVSGEEQYFKRLISTPNNSGKTATPAQAAVIVTQGLKNDGGQAQAAIDLATKGYITPQTEATLKAQGYTIPPQWVANRPNVGAAIAGAGKK